MLESIQTMTPKEVQAVASRIAELLADQTWVPAPVRPEPPTAPTPGALPAWAGSAQALSDVAPVTGRQGWRYCHACSIRFGTVAI